MIKEQLEYRKRRGQLGAHDNHCPECVGGSGGTAKNKYKTIPLDQPHEREKYD